MNRLLNCKKIEVIVKQEGKCDDFAICAVDEVNDSDDVIEIECEDHRTITLNKNAITQDKEDHNIFHCGLLHIYVAN